jgi:hypothetical protein
MKKPYLGSAAVVARMVSKILKESGYQKWSAASGIRQLEGFYVHRVGYSGTVHVSYHADNPWSKEGRNYKRSKVAQIRELLFELGYVSKHPTAIYIECQTS